MISAAQEKTLKAIDQKIQEPDSDRGSDAKSEEAKTVEAKLQSAPEIHQENSLEKKQEKSDSSATGAKDPEPPKNLEEKAVDELDRTISALKKGLGLFDFLPRVLSKALNRHLDPKFAEVAGVLGTAVGMMGMFASVVACATTPFIFEMLAACAASAMVTRFAYLLARYAQPWEMANIFTTKQVVSGRPTSE